jgi:hypothetical protein
MDTGTRITRDEALRRLREFASGPIDEEAAHAEADEVQLDLSAT